MRDVNVVLAVRNWYDFELCGCDRYCILWKGDIEVEGTGCVWRCDWLGITMCGIWADVSVEG